MRQRKILILFMFSFYLICSFSASAYAVFAADKGNHTAAGCYSQRIYGVMTGSRETDGESAEGCRTGAFEAVKVTLWKRFDSESADQRMMMSRDQPFFYFSKTKDRICSTASAADAANGMGNSGKHLSGRVLSYVRKGKTSSAAAMSAAADANINTKNSDGRNAILVQIELVIIFAEAAAGGGLGLSIKSDFALLKWYKNRKKGTYTQQ